MNRLLQRFREPPTWQTLRNSWLFLAALSLGLVFVSDLLWYQLANAMLFGFALHAAINCERIDRYQQFVERTYKTLEVMTDLNRALLEERMARKTAMHTDDDNRPTIILN
jgi:hypothetical protein